ncbi:MAG: HepT-like ribonuclease domain-containing protein [Opitutaceae bacterium]
MKYILGRFRIRTRLRNILAHGYDTIDHWILWAAVVRHLPTLRSEADGLIQGFEA